MRHPTQAGLRGRAWFAAAQLVRLGQMTVSVGLIYLIVRALDEVRIDWAPLVMLCAVSVVLSFVRQRALWYAWAEVPGAFRFLRVGGDDDVEIAPTVRADYVAGVVYLLATILAAIVAVNLPTTTPGRPAGILALLTELALASTAATKVFDLIRTRGVSHHESTGRRWLARLHLATPFAGLVVALAAGTAQTFGWARWGPMLSLLVFVGRLVLLWFGLFAREVWAVQRTAPLAAAS